MVRIAFRDEACRMHEIDAEADVSLMENAKARGMDGIEAECGGSMDCGTCQVYIAEPWFSTIASGQRNGGRNGRIHPLPASHLAPVMPDRRDRGDGRSISGRPRGAALKTIADR